MFRVFCRPFSFFISVAVSVPLCADVSEFDEFEPVLPEVLTPVRLQQPLAEVPASVTVISAEQVRAWGAHEITDVLRFVPGLFVADDLESNSQNVVYHSGDSTLARRIEVLVDGRSVYKASFATVDWQQLNIALEDIERVEVTRGPSASSYGLNALQAVIHIITRHPADSSQADVRLSYGSDQRRHGYASTAFQLGGSQQRFSVYGHREGEFSGYHADTGKVGGLPDLAQVKGFNWSGGIYDGQSDIRWQLSRQQSFRDGLADSNLQVNTPLAETTSDMGWLRWRSPLNPDHQLQLQGYWQSEDTHDRFSACVPTFALDPGLAQLYRQNDALATALAYGLLPLSREDSDPQVRQNTLQLYQGLAAGIVTQAALEQILETTLSQAEYLQAQGLIANLVNENALQQQVCGQADADVYQQRAELELQDTVRWSSSLRSVQGISYRRDEVTSQAYFGGTEVSEQWLAFVNGEYRASPDWLWSGAILATHEKDSGPLYSPRLAVNYLISPQSSLRLQYATSRRTPDLAERYLNASARVTDLSQPNYLQTRSGSLFLQASAEGWQEDLREEQIQAWEAGYFAYWPRGGWQLDIKLFHERLHRLIRSQMTLLNADLSNAGGLSSRGVEAQLSWQPLLAHRVWLSALAQRRDSDRDQELLLGSDRSLRGMWYYQGGSLNTAAGFIWDDQPADRKRQGFQQQRLLARLALNSGWGEWSLQAEYDLLAQRVLYQRAPDWLVWGGYRLQW